ncbi:MAG: choline dehydrogenase [Thermomicrobiales bacterium]|nr:choline dehydrogenase [Thermomicrobiales bacterium]
MITGSVDPGAFDYVVVGSGAGGGPVAANLAKAGKRVLLLEAGGDHENYNYQVPVFHGHATEDKDLSWEYFVRHYADDERQRRDSKFRPERDGVFYPRSGTLGGCTAHNAMITVYPLNQDWDRIAESTGDTSWRSDNMRQYFERMERCQYRRRSRVHPLYRLLAWILRPIPGVSRFFWNPAREGFGRHGFDGWLSTNLVDPKLVFRDEQLLKVVVAATRQTLVDDLQRFLTVFEDIPLFGDKNAYLDPNDWRVQLAGPEGLWLTPLATDPRKRNGTREYIRAVQAQFPDRLVVKTNALVTRVLFDGGTKAIGVEYLGGEHLYRADPNANLGAADPPARQAFVSGEVILAAGAFNTPQLLHLSGIGPAAELSRHGIEVRVDLPGVGANLQDRYEVGVVSEMHEDFALLQPECTFTSPLPDQDRDPCFKEWELGKGTYLSNGVVLGIVKKSRKERPAPDLFIFGLPGRFRGYFPGYSSPIERRYFTWAILKAQTRNTAGTVTLKSADPRDVPEINFRYFEEGNDIAGEDLQSVVDGIEFVRRMMRRATNVTKREVVPGEDVRTREELAEFVKSEAWGHHASCTCKMGPRSDPMAVVDSAFRVHGTERLRVVDASVFPRIPGFFIVTAVYMIGEKASEVILAGETAGVGIVERMTSQVRRMTTAMKG